MRDANKQGRVFNALEDALHALQIAKSSAQLLFLHCIGQRHWCTEASTGFNRYHSRLVAETCQTPRSLTFGQAVFCYTATPVGLASFVEASHSHNHNALRIRVVAWNFCRCDSAEQEKHTNPQPDGSTVLEVLRRLASR